ncbi:hypothetical protein [Streptomyces spiralis]
MVAEIAPEELPLVEGLRRFDDDTVIGRLRRGDRSDDPLGFGLGEVTTLLTPVVWLSLDEVARRMVGSAIDGATKSAKRKLRRIFRRSGEPLTVPALTRNQLSEVRRSVMESAVRSGVERRLSEGLADAVVVRLALGTREQLTDGPSGSQGDIIHAEDSGNEGGSPASRA